MSRAGNVLIFNDTEKICKTDEKLKSAIKNSSLNQKLILEEDEFGVPSKEVYSDNENVFYAYTV